MKLQVRNKLYDQLKLIISDCVKFEPEKRIEMTQVICQLEKIKKSVYQEQKLQELQKANDDIELLT